MRQLWQDLPIFLEERPDVGCEEEIFWFSVGADAKRVQVRNGFDGPIPGVEAATATAGTASGGELELIAVRFDGVGSVAAVFTRSLCASAAVDIDRELVQRGRAQLLFVVSKNANVFTGSSRTDLEQIVDSLSAEFSVPRDLIFVSCTGVIGVPLPVETIEQAIRGLSKRLAPGGLDAASRAILTTDRMAKRATARFGDVVVCAMAKGAGMVEPDMATMLCYGFTNARVGKTELDALLRRVADRTFNCTTVDSDTSTSDTMAMFATGDVELDEQGVVDLERSMVAVFGKLARDMVGQAEGAEKIIEVDVSIDTSRDDARILAKKIANSPLVKAAVHGADPNWGRIVMALGKPVPAASVDRIPPESVSIWLMDEPVFACGRTCDFDEAKLSEGMKRAKSVTVRVAVGEPLYHAKIWGCDLTEEYVTFNSEYTT